MVTSTPKYDYSKDYSFSAEVQLLGHANRSTSYETYCDHKHLYNFLYESVTPSDEEESADDFEVTGYTMTGITPDLCSYNSMIAVEFPVFEEEEQ